MAELGTTSEIKAFRDANEIRVSQANGAALATSVIAVATQPTLWPLLGAPCFLFALGITTSAALPILRFLQSLILSAFIRENAPLQVARDALNRTGGVQAAMDVLMESDKAHSRSVWTRTLKIIFYIIEISMVYYVVVGAILFISGVLVGILGALNHGISTEHGVITTTLLIG